MASPARQQLKPLNEAHDDGYFSAAAGFGTRATYIVLGTVCIVVTTMSFAAPLLTPECERESPGIAHLNPDYNFDPCWHMHRAILLGMSAWECDMNVRA